MPAMPITPKPNKVAQSGLTALSPAVDALIKANVKQLKAEKMEKAKANELSPELQEAHNTIGVACAEMVDKLQSATELMGTQQVTMVAHMYLTELLSPVSPGEASDGDDSEPGESAKKLFQNRAESLIAGTLTPTTRRKRKVSDTNAKPMGKAAKLSSK